MLTLFNDDSYDPLTISISASSSGIVSLSGENMEHKMEPFDYQAFLESQNIPDIVPPLSPPSPKSGPQSVMDTMNENAFGASVSGLPSFHPDAFAMMQFDTINTQAQQYSPMQYSQQLQQQYVSNLALRRAENANVQRVSSLSSSPRMSPYPTPTTQQTRMNLHQTPQDNMLRYIPTASSVASSIPSPNNEMSISPNTAAPRSNPTASAGTGTKPSSSSSRPQSSGLRRKPTPWTDDEERMLIDSVLGGIKPAWVEISKSLPGHSADNIRKHWSTITKRMTKRQRGHQIPQEEEEKEEEDE